jgi:hypothetical protein
VQHGNLWESRQAGGSPAPAQSRSLTAYELKIRVSDIVMAHGADAERARRS